MNISHYVGVFVLGFPLSFCWLSGVKWIRIWSHRPFWGSMPPDSPSSGAPPACKLFPCVHLQNLTLCCRLKTNILYWAYEINVQGWKKSLVLEGVGWGGGGTFYKLWLPRGVQFSQVIIFLAGGGKFMIDHTFLKCERKWEKALSFLFFALAATCSST